MVEEDLCKSIVSELTEQGYRVIWKEHPREKHPIYDTLSRHFTVEQLLRFPSSSYMPIEVAYAHYRYLHCVATISTSLFYLADLYGTKTYSFVNRVIDSLDTHARHSAEIVRNHNRMCGN